MCQKFYKSIKFTGFTGIELMHTCVQRRSALDIKVNELTVTFHDKNKYVKGDMTKKILWSPNESALFWSNRIENNWNCQYDITAPTRWHWVCCWHDYCIDLLLKNYMVCRDLHIIGCIMSDACTYKSNLLTRWQPQKKADDFYFCNKTIFVSCAQSLQSHITPKYFILNKGLNSNRPFSIFCIIQYLEGSLTLRFQYPHDNLFKLVPYHEDSNNDRYNETYHNNPLTLCMMGKHGKRSIAIPFTFLFLLNSLRWLFSCNQVLLVVSTRVPYHIKMSRIKYKSVETKSRKISTLALDNFFCDLQEIFYIIHR